MPIELGDDHADAAVSDSPDNVTCETDQDLSRLEAVAATERSQEALAPLMDSLERATAAFDPYVGLVTAFGALVRPWLEVAKPWIDAFRSIAPIVQARLREIPECYRVALLKIGEHGWYLDSDLPSHALFELADALEAGHESEVDRLLCDHVEDRLEGLEAEFAKAFPHRIHVIRAAFRAHRDGAYLLSVPVLLAQADGISKELTGRQLYARRNSRSVLSEVFDLSRTERLSRAIVAPLEAALPLTASTKDRKEAVSPRLNRHAILHGESTDYGTREISARAISLLSYVSWVLRNDAGDT